MKITKYIPDTVTSLNIACGVTGIVMAFHNRVDLAFAFMLAASVFDFLDGLCARALHAYSDMGKELDSLCDVVSFGVLPSVMLYNVCRMCVWSESWVCYVPLAISVFSALRLAKFNVDDRQKHSFLGLPTPAAAILCGALCYYVAAQPSSIIAQWCSNSWFIPVLSVMTCALLVCELPMFSFKFSKEDTRALKSKRLTFGVASAICAGYVAISGQHWSLFFVLTICVYILLNICFGLFTKE